MKSNFRIGESVVGKVKSNHGWKGIIEEDVDINLQKIFFRMVLQSTCLNPSVHYPNTKVSKSMYSWNVESVIRRPLGSVMNAQTQMVHLSHCACTAKIVSVGGIIMTNIDQKYNNFNLFLLNILN